MLRFLLIVLNLTCSYIYAQADTIYLKSGKVIESNILEENAEYIKIDFNGNPLYYQKKYISKIEKAAQVKDDAGAQTTDTGLALEGYFQKGLEAAVSGDFVLARQKFKQGFLRNNDDYNILAALNLLDDFDAGKISREYVVDLFNGLLSMLGKNYKQAIVYFKRVIEAKPDDIDVFYNLGVCYYSLDNFQEAISSFNKIIDIKPEDPEVYGLLGNAYYLAGDTQKAKESFVLARELFRKAKDVKSADEIEALLNRLFANQPSK